MFEIVNPSRWGEVAEIALRLGIAGLAGLIVGYPARARPGGVRVHLMVTLGAALFSNLALRFLGPGDDGVMRAVQGIVSGIGFIGAAAILKRGTSVVGLTNAATIWIAAALGCEAGLGDPVLALILAPIVTALNLGAHFTEIRWIRKKRAAKKR